MTNQLFKNIYISWIWGFFWLFDFGSDLIHCFSAMCSKRPFHEDEDDGGLGTPISKSKRLLTFQDVVRSVMEELALRELASKVEPLLRIMVREEVERAFLRNLHCVPRPLLNQIESSSGSSGWQLHFLNKLPSTIFTGSRVEAEDNVPVKIVIIDAISKTRIRSGLLPSVRTEILVLDGDFGFNEQENWSEKEFNENIVRERDDNSSWRRSRKFRFGARIVHRAFGGARIREAVSEAFVVKDHRGELYKKHYPPSLNDYVWRLNKISKDGRYHTRLASHGLHTVKDFLRVYFRDSSLLRNILGSGITEKTFNAIIDHATTCDMNNEFYTYHRDVQRAGLLLNPVYRVLGVTFDGQNYHPLDTLSPSQMLFVEDLKQHAYENLKDLVPTDEPSFGGPSRSLSVQAVPYTCPTIDFQQHDLRVMLQDTAETQLDYNNSTASTSFEYGIRDYNQLEEVSVAQNSQQMQMLTPTMGNSFFVGESSTGLYNGGSCWVSDEPHIPNFSLGNGNGNFDIQMHTWFPFENDKEVAIFSSFPTFGFHIARGGKPKAGWCKIRAAFKWLMMVRRDVAAKRVGRSLVYM